MVLSIVITSFLFSADWPYIQGRHRVWGKSEKGFLSYSRGLNLPLSAIEQNELVAFELALIDHQYTIVRCTDPAVAVSGKR